MKPNTNNKNMMREKWSTRAGTENHINHNTEHTNITDRKTESLIIIDRDEEILLIVMPNIHVQKTITIVVVMTNTTETTTEIQNVEKFGINIK